MQKNYNHAPDIAGEGMDNLPAKTTLISRNVTVMGRRTSVRLEPEMWAALREIALREDCTIHDVCTLIGMCKKRTSSLTASIRVFLMLYFRAATTEDGHKRAGHGDFEYMKKRARVSEHLLYFSKKKKPFTVNEPEYGQPVYQQV
jgi:predicted DNA-binding ribbon-helix-helix protein